MVSLLLQGASLHPTSRPHPSSVTHDVRWPMDEERAYGRTHPPSGPKLLCQMVFLEEDIGSDHYVPAAGSVLGRGWIHTGALKRPTRDRTDGDRVISLEHSEPRRL